MKVKFSKKALAAISSLVLVTSVASTSAYSAGVPVIDVSAIAQAVAQVENQVQQIKQLDAQIRAITDNGNYADILNNPTVRSQLNKYLPKGYNDIFEAARRGDLGALEQVARQAAERERQAKTSQTGVERYKAAQLWKEVQMTKMMDDMTARSNTLQSLVNRINTTQNTAQKQDLTNALTAQSAMLNLQMNQMQLVMQQARQEEAKAARQANGEAYKKTQAAQREYLKKKYPNSLR